MGLVASRIAPKQLKVLDKVNAELADSTKDTARFVTTWEKGEMIAFSAVKNPALTVIAEILHWVRVGVDPAVTADAKGLPWVSKTNRNAQRLLFGVRLGRLRSRLRPSYRGLGRMPHGQRIVVRGIRVRREADARSDGLIWAPW